MQKDNILAALQNSGLSRLTTTLTPAIQESIRIRTHPVSDQDVKLGVSRFGGKPDLPARIAWPERLSFLAQIRLSDLNRVDEAKPLAKLLPLSGILYFFYDALQETYGDKVTDASGWQVIYIDDERITMRRPDAPASINAQGQYRPCTLDFSVELTLPLDPKANLPQLEWSSEEQSAYSTFMETFPTKEDHTTPRHRIFGNSNELQDDMHTQVQRLANGISDPNDPRVAELDKTALDWVLLLQIDSDPNTGMRWGDEGMLYFWIHKDDLAAQRFNKVWMIFQTS